MLNASVRTILLSTITDHILTTEFDVLDDGTRRLSEVRLRMYTQLITRSHEKSATDTDYFCESFRYEKSVDNGGLAQMERLLQFGRVLSRSTQLGNSDGQVLRQVDRIRFVEPQFGRDGPGTVSAASTSSRRY